MTSLNIYVYTTLVSHTALIVFSLLILSPFVCSSPTVLNGGFFNATKYYPIALLQIEGSGIEHVQVQYRSVGGSYSSVWSGLLRNLVDGGCLTLIYQRKTLQYLSLIKLTELLLQLFSNSDL